MADTIRKQSSVKLGLFSHHCTIRMQTADQIRKEDNGLEGLSNATTLRCGKPVT